MWLESMPAMRSMQNCGTGRVQSCAPSEGEPFVPFSIERNDIAHVHADVLVNAANEQLAPGGGVCGALFASAGFDRMNAACRAVGHCPTGAAVATPGFDLPCKWVVHAVGPVWRGGAHGEERQLRSCYQSIFAEVERLGAHSVAYPLISAGIFGYPKAEALRVAREETAAFLDRIDDDIRVTLVVFSRDVILAGGSLLTGLQEFIDDAYVESSPHARRRMEERETLPNWVLEDEELAPLPPVPSTQPSAPSSAYFAAALEQATFGAEPEHECGPESEPKSTDLDDLLNNLDKPFSTTLLALIDARGMTDVQVYKRANISRQLFAKIRANASYRPTKPTAVALALALELDYDQTQDLLSRAGLTLSHSSKFDVIIEFFIDRGVYDIFRVNEALFAYDQPLLGSM